MSGPLLTRRAFGGLAAGGAALMLAKILPPIPLILRINAEINAIAADPTTQARMQDQGAVARGGTPEAFADYIRSETTKWAEVIRAANATVD